MLSWVRGLTEAGMLLEFVTTAGALGQQAKIVGQVVMRHAYRPALSSVMSLVCELGMAVCARMICMVISNVGAA